MCFNASFWNERYSTNQTGWDLKGPSTPLKEYIDQITNKNIKILIPGCGNAYEAEYLLEKGADKTLKDGLGKTAYDYAAGQENHELMELLQ